MKRIACLVIAVGALAGAVATTVPASGQSDGVAAPVFRIKSGPDSYEVTVVNDATADYSDEQMHAALDVNLPNYANAIVSTEEIVASISALENFGACVERSDSRASGVTSIQQGLQR
jgi:hypothetical protein